MKKKLLLITLTFFYAATVMGCGAEPTAYTATIPFEKIETVQTEEATTQENTTEESATEDNTSEDDAIQENATNEDTLQEDATEAESRVTETEVADVADFTFADLAERRFEFSSGAGGWWEEFTIEKDGYFVGNYHDSDMGDTGEGYADGTVYSSSYFGHFTDLTKIDDHTYKMKLADISYEEMAGTVEIFDNTRYIYTDAYCLGGTDTFTVYLPGTALSELPEEVHVWISDYNQSETELTMIIIVDETNGYGIYSHNRQKPLEDAQRAFDDCKESYDYYGKKVSEALTTAEMVEYTGTMYAISDDCLNYIWNLIRYNVEEDKFNEILAEQRVWISEKETTAQEISSEYDGGSFTAVSYNDTLASLTLKRCEELIEYLK